MIRNSICKPVICSLIVLMSGTALAESKVVTVDIAKVLNESKEAKQKKAELEAMSQEAKKKVDAKRASLHDMEEKLSSGKVAEDSKEAMAFRSQSRDFTNYVKDTEDELRQHFLKVNRVLTDRTVAVIKQYAESHNLDLVLDHSTGQRGVVLYGSAQGDITDAIVKRINQ